MNIDEWLFNNINIEDMINQKTRFLPFSLQLLYSDHP